MATKTGPSVEFTSELISWFNTRWSGELGAIDGKDLAFVGGLFADTAPGQVVEIGCASGLSLSMMAALLEQVGPARIDSFDIDDRFYVDRSKPVGYLLSEAPAHPRVEVRIWPKTTSLDVGNHVTEAIDVCFIDAAHKHPWPLIDTLAILPRMKPGGLIIHHDLKMFRDRRHHATGPKVLFDQLPAHIRIVPRDVAPPKGVASLNARRLDDNIYALRVPSDWQRFAAEIGDGLYVTWDKGVAARIPEAFRARFRAFVSKTYGERVLQAFEGGFARS